MEQMAFAPYVTISENFKETLYLMESNCELNSL